MTIPKLLVSGIHILAVLIMSASAAYIISHSFAYERWLEKPLMEAFGWNRAALAWTLFGVFSAEGLLLSFLGRAPGFYTLLLFLFFLPSLYAHSSLSWLEFVGIEVDATQSKVAVGALSICLIASYLTIRMVRWMDDMQLDLQRRKASSEDARGAFYFSAIVLSITVVISASVGLVLAVSVESAGDFLSAIFGNIPLGILTIGLASVATVAWAIRRLISSQNLLSRDLWSWRR